MFLESRSTFVSMNAMDAQKARVNKFVLAWLVIGLILVFMQIVIGGITRLTGSGLSITEWDIIYGSIPPLTESNWISEFDKYKLTPQYEKLNVGMEIGSIFQPGTFKFIYFWEYLHRVWARGMGFVFLFPFLFFYFKKLIPPSLFRRLLLVIGLAALAATFGWIMVASGLIDRPWVNAYKLSIHLCIGISVFIALWWAFIRYRYAEWRIKKLLIPGYLYGLLALLIVQIFLGGVMSGTKAALFINTWPDMNGAYVPDILVNADNWSQENFNQYDKDPFLVTLIQFLHRMTAYVILTWSVIIFYQHKLLKSSIPGAFSYQIYFGLIIAQIIVGILTLLKSMGSIPVIYGVLHQGIAVLLLSTYFTHVMFTQYSKGDQQMILD